MLTSPFSASDKAQIADRFGRAASTYHELAIVQQAGAKHLISFTAKDWFKIPAGSLLEIGCGTGFLTQELIDRFGQRSLLATDLSLQMLQFCQAHLRISAKQNRVSFQQLDGEKLSIPAQPYALIASGFALQWFDHPIKAIARWLQAIQPGGWLLISFPTDRSFPEWRQICQDFNLPLTLNPLPDADMLLQKIQSFPVRCFTEESVTQTVHPNAIDFLRSLKAIGAGANLTGKQLSIKQLKQLSIAWKAQNYDTIVASHSIAYWAIQRMY